MAFSRIFRQVVNSFRCFTNFTRNLMCAEAVASNRPNVAFVSAENVLEQDCIVIVQNLLLYSRQVPAARPRYLIVSRIAAANGSGKRLVLLLELGQLRV